MPRYLVERSFPLPWDPPSENTPSCDEVIEAHRCVGAVWRLSYLAPDQRRSYCIVDGPSPEAVRMAAGASGLPVDRITEVRLLDPFANARKEQS